MNNPVQQTLQEIGQQKNQIPENQEEESEEASVAQVEHTPSFFSQRFAQDLFMNGGLENQENFD